MVCIRECALNTKRSALDNSVPLLTVQFTDLQSSRFHYCNIMHGT